MDNMNIAFTNVVDKYRHVRWDAALEGMTQAEYAALYAIDRAHAAQPDKPGVYVSVLAQRLKISVSMASKSLKALEEKGWVLRTVDPNSRRNTFVSLTEEGQQNLSREVAHTSAVNRHVFERMGPERMERFLEDANMLVDCFADLLGTK